MIKGICKIPFNWIANKIDPPAVVLLYHRVATLDSDPQLLAVSPSNFRGQMKYLADNFPVLRFEGDWSKISVPSVVVTFDDGYYDNFTEALPILEEFGIPATFFVSAGNVGAEGEFWWDELERLILKDALPSSFTLADDLYGGTWRTGESQEKFALYNRMQRLMKKINEGRRTRWLDQLRLRATEDGKARPTHRAMTVSELQRLAQSPLATIGAHCITHTSLSALTLEEQKEEILGSKKRLEKWLGKTVAVFAYPFGGYYDFTEDSPRICRESGFTRVAANFPGQAHRWTNPFKIPRNIVRNWGVDEFKEKLSTFRLM